MVVYRRAKGLKVFKDRHGKQRCYHRKTGLPIDLTKFPIGSDGFWQELDRLNRMVSPAAETKPGTLGLLIAKYRAHAQFQDLAPRTQADYQRIFNYLQPIADTPLSKFTPPLVVKIRDKAAEKLGRKWGNYTKTVLSVVFGFGVERGFIHSNPAFNIKGIRRPKDLPQANRPWTDDEREAVLAALPTHMVLPITLMMFCGLDPADALKLRRNAIQDGMIDSRRAKTGEPVWIPLPHPVREALATAPNHDALTICANSRGQSWTTSGFNSSWVKLRARLLKEEKIKSGLTLKGLRHTVATILAEIGMDDRTIADMLGQRTLAMAQHYSNRANRSRKLTGVVEQLDAEVTRRQRKGSDPQAKD